MAYSSDSNQVTRDYFDSLLVETRYMGAELASTEMKLWGEKFDTPIMTAALSHLYDICPNAMAEYARGAKLANTVGFFGMGEDEDLEVMCETGAKVVKIIKPHEKNEEVFRKIEHAVKCGAFAVGMDIDHAFCGKGGYDLVCGLPMKEKSMDEMREFVAASEVPFVIKGVNSVHDAQMSVEVGAKAILVSHHHGIMPSSVPPLMVLPDIVKAVGGQVKIFVDCGIESGMDVFKALALGADAVCVGRDLMEPLKNGAEGVQKRILEMTGELQGIMSRTGSKSITQIDPTLIHKRNF